MDKNKKLTFMEILAGAARPYPELWHDNGRLNFKALERHYKLKGHPISQPTFVRIDTGESEAGERTVSATAKVFGIPGAMLRGEPMSHTTENLLIDYNVSTLLLAKRIEDLPKADYHQVAELVRTFEEKAAHLRRVMASSSNVTQLDPKKK